MKKILLGIPATLLFLITLTAIANANTTPVSWIYDSGQTGIAVTDVNISKDSSKDSGITVTGFIENKDPDATKLAVTLNLHMYDKSNQLLGILPIHPSDMLKPLQKIHFTVKDPTRQTAINLDHVYLQVQAFDCGTASVHNMGCFGQTASVTKKDTNETEKKLPPVKATLPSGVFKGKAISVSNLSAVGNGDSYDILGIIKNISNETKTAISLVVEIYNSSNNLVGVNQGTPILTTIPPRQESPFKINTDVPRLSNDHYVVSAITVESFNNEPPVNTASSNNDIGSNYSNNVAQSEKPRTFQDCYSQNIGLLTLALIFEPSEKISFTNLLDPAYKKLIINMCNFYHEKTGIWINLINEGDKRYIEQYGIEFYQKYGDTIPESLKQLRTEQELSNQSK